MAHCSRFMNFIFMRAFFWNYESRNLTISIHLKLRVAVLVRERAKSQSLMELILISSFDESRSTVQMFHFRPNKNTDREILDASKFLVVITIGHCDCIAYTVGIRDIRIQISYKGKQKMIFRTVFGERRKNLNYVRPVILGRF